MVCSMPSFTTKLATAQGHQTFYFNRLHHSGQDLYHVSVMSHSGTAETFYMRKEDSEWRLVASFAYPLWIVSMEATIAEVIVTFLDDKGNH